MGCLRPWVPRLIWVLTILILGIVTWGSIRDPEAMWAPGDISRYHADVSDCWGCHEPFRGATVNKCRSCHTDVWFTNHAESEVRRFHQDLVQSNQFCAGCHLEHRGVLAAITIGVPRNPHGEFIFRVTGADSCSDCHIHATSEGQPAMTLLLNEKVQHLFEEGEGAHQVGRFAHCGNCHRGGLREMDGHRDD
ncbi:MAG: hypothetical protein KC590_06805 [Nitrospira sp.]|nr:hypothetical protein [Nitrospira sp.]